MIEKEYLASRVAAANEAQLVAIVYEGLIDTLNECISNIDKKESIDDLIDKCRDILAELISTLKGDSEVPNRYRSLYLYINNIITEGYIMKDKSKFEEAIKVITPLYEGWNELGQKMYIDNIQKNKAPKLVAGMTYSKGYVNESVMNNQDRWEKG
ncbi:MAG: flagellar protein FliS [Tepidibacter sp.]|jgi:flagellar protein FliS|uniref:flagellar export chaperone FliS n=1 Tax=Tepidibacter sp. TaxID=2529387 RepID=UPI0025DD88C0|nr:flagellar export chaperone FliS [Tepidibacter sp.]MCT4508853.1 flagellar protein FliS [Tepidibacter sp.]